MTPPAGSPAAETDPGAEAPAARRLRGAVAQLLGGGRSGTLIPVLLLFLVMVGTGRVVPDARPATRAAPLSEQVPPAFRGGDPALPAALAPRSPAAEPMSPEGVAIDNLLSRYDALIRLLEGRAIGPRSTGLDTALAELRELRGRTYTAARRALRQGAEPSPSS